MLFARADQKGYMALETQSKDSVLPRLLLAHWRPFQNSVWGVQFAEGQELTFLSQVKPLGLQKEQNHRSPQHPGPRPPQPQKGISLQRSLILIFSDKRRQGGQCSPKFSVSLGP